MSRTKSLLVVTLIGVCFTAIGSSLLLPVAEAQKVKQLEALVQAYPSESLNWISVLVTVGGVGLENLGATADFNKDGITLPAGWTLRAIGLNAAGDPTDYNSCQIRPTYFTNDGGGTYAILFTSGSCDLTRGEDIAFLLSYASPTVTGGTVGKLLIK